MEYQSILYAPSSGPPEEGEGRVSRDTVIDLNLGPVLESIVKGRDRDYLLSIYLHPLHTIREVRYRQEVFRDLQRQDLVRCAREFHEKIERFHRYLHLAARSPSQFYARGWFFSAVAEYCHAVTGIFRSLREAPLESGALRELLIQLTHYVESEHFAAMKAKVEELAEPLERVEYCLDIRGRTVRISPFRGECDYRTRVGAAFGDMSREASRDYVSIHARQSPTSWLDERIAESVAQFYPETFGELRQFCDRHRDFLEPAVVEFDRDLQFYISYIDEMSAIADEQLKFCIPEVVVHGDEFMARDMFDLALAGARGTGDEKVVTNSFHLGGGERILMITGANQGGKTTFARAVGQIHFFAAIGCPVPARSARLQLCDAIFTHFEREEDLRRLRGKMEDDLLRIRDILEHMTSKSLLIMNEIFTSATPADELSLSRGILRQIIEKRALGVWVTFLEELSQVDETVVSMVPEVDPRDPSIRTYRVRRRRPDGMAYARSLAQKYGLTREQIEERIR
ncbi:MAG: DNA mismatch repair protein MutS [Bacillota bacterium]